MMTKKLSGLEGLTLRGFDDVLSISPLKMTSGFNDVLGTSSLKMTSGFHDVVGTSSAKISENIISENNAKICNTSMPK